MVQFVDRAEIGRTKIASDGTLVTTARAVRTGVQLYAGYEVGRPDLAVVEVMRPADEVFAPESLQSFSHAPITIDHPAEPVTPDNWKDLAVGEVSTAATRDGEWIALPLILKDADAIKAVQSGKRELSAGYTCDLEWDGDRATQKNIRINHLAVVDTARAGHEARIGDSNWGARPIPVTDDKKETPVSTKNVMVDGLSVETTEQGAQAIAKLTADRDGLTKQLADAQAAHDKAMADADAKLAKAEAERDAALEKVMDEAALDAAVTARADLITKAKKLAPSVVTDGKSALDIKKAVLVGRKIALDGKSDAYIEARFDTLVEDSDQTADALGNVVSVGDAASKMEDAHAKMMARFNGGAK